MSFGETISKIKMLNYSDVCDLLCLMFQNSCLMSCSGVATVIFLNALWHWINTLFTKLCLSAGTVVSFVKCGTSKRFYYWSHLGPQNKRHIVQVLLLETCWNCFCLQVGMTKHRRYKSQKLLVTDLCLLRFVSRRTEMPVIWMTYLLSTANDLIQISL